MKLNIFTPRKDDFQNMLDYMGKDILLNNEPARAVITKHIDNVYNVSTFVQLKRGDHIVYEGNDFYITDNPSIQQYESYKAKMTNAEHDLYFNLSEYDSGTGYTSFRVLQLPSIVDVTTALQLDGSSMLMQTGHITVIIQDNELTREIADSLGGLNEHRVRIGGKSYTYEGFDFVDIGLVHITVKTASSYPDSTYDISWQDDPSAWNGEVVTMYQGQPAPDPNPEPEPPLGTTDVGTVTIVVYDETSEGSANGAIEIDFEPDVNAVDHYKVELYDSTETLVETKNVPHDEVATTISVTFSGLGVDTYSVNIYSYNGTDYLEPHIKTGLTVSTSSGGWG